ncbi:uncharacterized protein MELLADRAFT_94379 [Melampsora larici-populina 98AG31]|uniref:Uncharacterized protein n=1 Tax=Melampsora larici-populina (strain 98AG31 / pathotype 3-4-7) TaxID=747676 RepID=F4RBA5_MELLP|nr:uncharacterized protein MELLADRAFT_94379 [Melampsora larici-populina 98AG31]EGG10050.1 hypothetical protein MELLADRAFT_94379 [Melampsora larici-populina 98AG31]
MQGTDSNTPTTQTSAAITPEAGSSVPILPSREHNRLLYPQPHPTILSSTSPEPKSKKDKGKSKARDPTPSISDWNPDDDDTDQSDTDLDLSQAHSRQPSPCDKAKKSGPPPAKNPESEVPQESSAMPESRTPDIENLHLLLMRTNQKVEYLESELKALTKVVHKLSGLLGDGASTPSPSKRRGGRTADRIRFHVDTLLGIKEGSKLPNPTDDTTNVPEDPSTSGTRDETDPCFPYENGPGHKDATPQQLQIMKSMLEAAGLSSFRPDFSKSAASNGNKWIWNVASKIFYKLVECGEYNGVATGGANDTLITKCLDTYARSLSKRYRLQSWEPERLEKSQSRVRQAGRLQK